MAISTIKISLNADCEKVWDVMTSKTNYFWRSDIEHLESNGNMFAEYSKEGLCTIFTITCEEKYKRWEFDMDNKYITGHWIGEFIAKEGMTELILTENVTAKNLFMKPFVKGYLKKQQALYVADLKRVLNCE